MISVNVKNVQDPAPSTTVNFFVDGQFIGSEKLPSLDRNAAAVAKVEWIAPAVGVFSAEVKVQSVPGETVVDDNEDALVIEVV